MITSGIVSPWDEMRDETKSEAAEERFWRRGTRQRSPKLREKVWEKEQLQREERTHEKEKKTKKGRHKGERTRGLARKTGLSLSIPCTEGLKGGLVSK